jgi:tetratricopeptide (TPR) repeat protein
MVDPVDNGWPEPSGPEFDPPGGFPQPMEDLDALLNAVACETFDDGRLHRMTESLRLRIIADSLKVRDQAAADFLELLREKEAMNPVALPAPLALVPGSGSPAGDTLPVHRRPELAEATSPKPTWGRKALGWVGGRSFRLALSACVLLCLGALAWSGYRHQQGEVSERLRRDENFAFVEQVITQFCSPVPNTVMPPGLHRGSTYNPDVCQKALSACQQFLALHQANPSMRRETGRVQYWMGCILLLLGDQDEAQIALEKALPPLQSLAVELPEQPAYQRMVGEIHLNLASLLAEEKTTAARAEQAFGRALESFTELTRHHPAQPSYRFQLAMAREQLGAFFSHTGRNQEAEQQFRQTQRLLNDLEKRDAGGSAAYRLGLAQSHLSLGAIRLAAGHHDQAMEEFSKAGAILARLPVDGASVSENRSYLAGQWNQLANCMLQKGRLADARRGYVQARDLWEGLTKAFPQDPDYRSHLGFALLQLALAVREQGDLDECCRLLNAAVEHQQAALAAKKCELHREALRDAYLALAATQLRRHDYAKAAEAAEQLPRANPNRWQEEFRAVSFLARCLVMAEKDRRLEQAQRQEFTACYGRKLQQHLTELRRRAPDNAGASNALAWFLATCPKPELRQPAQALALAQKATQLEKGVAGYWNTLGVVYCRLKKWDQAVVALRQSVRLSGEGDCVDWLFLAIAYHKLDREAEARRWYDRALTWMDEHKPQDEELLRFRDEATRLIGPSRALTRAAVMVESDD